MSATTAMSTATTPAAAVKTTTTVESAATKASTVAAEGIARALAPTSAPRGGAEIVSTSPAAD